jgi:hypothetical protein
MKILVIWSNSSGNSVFKEPLDNIQKLKVLENSLYVLLKNGFSKVYSLEENGFGYSFKVS